MPSLYDLARLHHFPARLWCRRLGADRMGMANRKIRAVQLGQVVLPRKLFLGLPSRSPSDALTQLRTLNELHDAGRKRVRPGFDNHRRFVGQYPGMSDDGGRDNWL